MRRAVASVFALLIVGHAVMGALAWTFLQVPESTVWMLGLSALLVLLVVIIAIWVETTALDAFVSGRGVSLRLTRGLAAMAGVLIGMIVFGLVWMGLSRAEMRLAPHLGEVHAWTLLHLGRKISFERLQAIVDWIFWALKYVFALTVAVGYAASAVQGGTVWPARHPGRWLAASFGWRMVIGIAGALLVLIYLPASFAYWHPRHLAGDAKELLFVGAKLGVLYLVINFGWLAVLATSARAAAARNRPPAVESREA